MPQNAELAQLIADVKEQVLYMQELGVETLDVDLAKIPARIAEAASNAEQIHQPQSHPVSELKFETPKRVETNAPSGSKLSSLPSLSNRKSAMPVKAAASAADPDLSEANKASLLTEALPALPEPTETIEQIRAEIGPDCTRCKLHTLGRSKVVNSTGNFNAELMFVGEAPGADEDEQGEPFVGRAGQLLTKIIEGIGLSREDVFIGNINRCRPPGNRAPETDESVVCKPFLLREIAVVRPKVIVVLGATAAQNLLETKVPIGKLRGHFHDHLGVKVMPTFHPAYLLRDPRKKREVWEDMKMVRDYLSALK